MRRHHTRLSQQFPGVASVPLVTIVACPPSTDRVKYREHTEIVPRSYREHAEIAVTGYHRRESSEPERKAAAAASPIGRVAAAATWLGLGLG